MNFLTIRELSKSPAEALTKLTVDKKAVLTNNGKPQALIFKIDADSFEKTLVMLQKLECMHKLTEMRQVSRENGTLKMGLDEINEEINIVRKKIKNKIKNA